MQQSRKICLDSHLRDAPGHCGSKVGEESKGVYIRKANRFEFQRSQPRDTLDDGAVGRDPVLSRRLTLRYLLLHSQGLTCGQHLPIFHDVQRIHSSNSGFEQRAT